MSVRLIVNATILNQTRQTGLGVYAAGLLLPLLKLCVVDSRLSEIVLAGRRESIESSFGSVCTGPKMRLVTVNTTQPIGRLFALDRLMVAEKKRPGGILFYSPTHHGVVRRGFSQIITVHDLFGRLFPNNYRQQYLYFRWYLPRILARTSRVMVDSVSTGRDLHRFYADCPPSEVVHAALRSDLVESPLCESPLDEDERFFLFVGPSYRYKNCKRLIDAFFAYRHTHSGKLVFAGGREEYLRDLRQHLSEHYRDLAQEVIFLSYPSAEELSWLYRRATALMLTTLYEGFGLPALEAMACDCPVVASRAGSLPEVCGEAALFVDPEKVDSIACAMVRVANDRALRESLIAAGRQNVLRFSWEKSALKVYQALLACADEADAAI
jgi:glycosyltransferase involved in cell wall biosynthesis